MKSLPASVGWLLPLFAPGAAAADGVRSLRLREAGVGQEPSLSIGHLLPSIYIH